MIDWEDLPITVQDELSSRARARGDDVESVARTALIKEVVSGRTAVELRDAGRNAASAASTRVAEESLAMLAAAVTGTALGEALEATASHLAAVVAVQYLEDSGQLAAANEYVRGFHERMRAALNNRGDDFAERIDDTTLTEVTKLLFTEGTLTASLKP